MQNIVIKIPLSLQANKTHVRGNHMEEIRKLKRPEFVCDLQS